jgi:hypothetical protein
MLPGFRFLFAAIVLSMSILVFGLGAAALLRAAHEEFASNPSWRAPPETMFAQQAEATKPVLAMLRIEPPPAVQKTPDQIPAVAAAAEPAAIIEQAAPTEAAMPEIPAPENSVQSEAAATQADTLSVADTKIAAPDPEMMVASTGQASPVQIFSPAGEAAPLAAEPAAPEQMSTQASPEIDAASTKIATLGGPPVTIEPPPAKAVSEKADRSAVKKRQEARRAAHRRKVAARARLAAQSQQAQQAQQQPLGLFGQPQAQPPAAARNR